jgi:hypothetical protein
MSWAPKTSGVNTSTTSNITNVTATTGAVAVGDVMLVMTFWDTGNGGTSAVVTDSLGNIYTRVTTALSDANNNKSEVWFANITVAGTPTVTARVNPSPGGTTAAWWALVADPFSGGSASSVTDGSNRATNNSLGTGTDANTSGSITPTVSGDLIWTGCGNGNGGTQPGTVGTGFTLNTTSLGSQFIRTGYRVQATAAAVAGTFTGTNTNDIMDVHVVAITTGTGGGGVAARPMSRIQIQQAALIRASRW